MDIKQINSHIMFGTWTDVELTSVINAVKFAKANLQRQIKRGLTVGDNVSFTSSKTGRTVTGHVVKIAIKYVTVRTVEGLWKVPANMLSVLEEA
jgi:small-conductance mechanosensitive channel